MQWIMWPCVLFQDPLSPSPFFLCVTSLTTCTIWKVLLIRHIRGILSWRTQEREPLASIALCSPHCNELALSESDKWPLFVPHHQHGEVGWCELVGCLWRTRKEQATTKKASPAPEHTESLLFFPHQHIPRDICQTNSMAWLKNLLSASWDHGSKLDPPVCMFGGMN